MCRGQGPNVVGLVGLGFNKDGAGRALEAVLLMEKVSNTSLQDLVCHDPTRPLPCVAQYTIALGIAKGMAHLHSLRVENNKPLIHHDLKSANVMVVDKADGVWGAKLIDFGESRGTGITSTRGASADHSSVGTEGYKAPEQSSNPHWGRPRCDQLSEAYSFAVIVWQLATREVPSLTNRCRLDSDVLLFPDKVSAATHWLIEAAGAEDPEKRKAAIGEKAVAFENIVHFLTSSELHAPLQQSWRSCLEQELRALAPASAAKLGGALGVDALGQSGELLELLSEKPSGGLEGAVRACPGPNPGPNPGPDH